MKIKLIGSVFTLFVSLMAYAQPTQGSYVVGGSMSFSHSNRESFPLRTDFSISPSAGKFVSDKWLLTAGLGYALDYRKHSAFASTQYKDWGHNFSLSFDATRYFQLKDKLYFTLSSGIAPQLSFYERTTLDGEHISDGRSFTMNINVRPGLTYFLNDNWMLYANMGAFNINGYWSDNSFREYNVNLNLSANSFGLGVRYIINRKKKK